MKRSVIQTLFLIPIFLLLGVANLNAQAYEAEGTWEITWETPAGDTRSFSVTLVEAGELLEGTAEIPRNFFTEEAEAGMEEYEIINGDTHGRMVTFKIQPMHPHHELMTPPREQGAEEMRPHTIAVYAAFEDTEMEGYMTGVMPQPETAVPFVGQKRY